MSLQIGIARLILFEGGVRVDKITERTTNGSSNVDEMELKYD